MRLHGARDYGSDRQTCRNHSVCSERCLITCTAFIRIYIYILNLCTTCVEWTPQWPFWLPITRPIYNALNDVSRSSACVPSLSLHLSAEVFVWIEPTAVVTGQFVFGRNSCASLGDNKEWNWRKYVLRWGVQNKCTRK